MWEISLTIFTCLVLVYLGSFTCALHASLYGQFLLHVLCCFMWGVSLTRLMLFCVESFSYMSLAVLCEEFLLHASAILCGEFLLHAPCCFTWGVSLTLPMLFYVGSFSYTPLLFYVGSFSYTPRAVVCGEFPLHVPCCFMWGVSPTRPMLYYRGSFSYTPLAVVCGEFLLHAPFCFMRGVTLTHPRLFHVWRFSWKLLTFVNRKLTNQCKNKVCWVKSVYRASDQASVSCRQNDMANEPNGLGQSITDWNGMRGFMASPLAFAFDRHSWSGYASVQTDRGSEPTQPASLHHQSLEFVSHHFSSFLSFSVLQSVLMVSL